MQDILTSYLQTGTKKIVLKVDDENTLLALEAKARLSGLITSVVKDAGKTEIPAGTITACAIGPGNLFVIGLFTLM